MGACLAPHDYGLINQHEDAHQAWQGLLVSRVKHACMQESTLPLGVFFRVVVARNGLTCDG